VAARPDFLTQRKVARWCIRDGPRKFSSPSLVPTSCLGWMAPLSGHCGSRGSGSIELWGVEGTDFLFGAVSSTPTSHEGAVPVTVVAKHQTAPTPTLPYGCIPDGYRLVAARIESRILAGSRRHIIGEDAPSMFVLTGSQFLIQTLPGHWANGIASTNVGRLQA
jgi:hypothetical protein